MDMHISQPSTGTVGPGETPAHDPVNSPAHYQGKTLQVINVIERLRCGAHMGNVIKYIMRAPNKGNIEDLQKAIWYLKRAMRPDVGPLRTEVPSQEAYNYDTIREEFGVSNMIATAYTCVVIAIANQTDFYLRCAWLERAADFVKEEIKVLQLSSGGAG
jgi:hypothetical protein